MAELVSVLIPAYNAAPWLVAAVQSALDQTWPNIEVVIVDDGSQDATLSCARRLQSDRVKVFSQPNSGAAAARNRAFDECLGKYIQYLDADDLLLPHKVATQVEVLQDYPSRCVSCCSFGYIFDGAEPNCALVDDTPREVGDENDPAIWLLRMHGLGRPAGMVQTSGWLTPRALIAAAGRWRDDTAPDDDGEFFNRVALASNGVRVVARVGCYYRQHLRPTNLASGKTWGAFAGRLRALDLKAGRLLDRVNTPEARQLFADHYFNLAAVSYPRYPDLSSHALQKASYLGQPTDRFMDYGRLTAVRRLFGWRLARRLSHWRNRLPRGRLR